MNLQVHLQLFNLSRLDFILQPVFDLLILRLFTRGFAILSLHLLVIYLRDLVDHRNDLSGVYMGGHRTFTFALRAIAIFYSPATRFFFSNMAFFMTGVKAIVTLGDIMAHFLRLRLFGYLLYCKALIRINLVLKYCDLAKLALKVHLF